jgi:hypothetical protein
VGCGSPRRRAGRDLPRFQIPLSEIRELDEPFWFSLEASPTGRAIIEHARLIEAADLAFPIILSSDGRVMDGMHRGRHLIGPLQACAARTSNGSKRQRPLP